VRDDPYVALGVRRGASTDEITAAFRAQAKELHPDLHLGDERIAERFKQLTDAYRVLSRPSARAAYDARSQIRSTGAPARTPGTPVVGHEPVFRTPGRARAAVWGGVALVLVGIAAGVLMATLPTGDSAKTITLWIVVAKLVICGALLWAAGAWRLHKLRAAPFATRK
jgi:hypothetical protein